MSRMWESDSPRREENGVRRKDQSQEKKYEKGGESEKKVKETETDLGKVKRLILKQRRHFGMVRRGRVRSEVIVRYLSTK